MLEIVSALCSHLEYQKSLGVRWIEELSAQRSASPVNTDVPPVVRLSTPVSAPAVVSQARQVTPAKSVPAVEATAGLAGVRAELGDCTRCALSRSRTNIVFGEGDPKASIFFIGEAPGSEEDKLAKPFTGEPGQLFTDIIVKGMKIRREDVYVCTIVMCRPPADRKPETAELVACEPFIRKQILAVRPQVIVTLGNVPTHALLKTKEGITKLRGTWHTYEGIPVMPTYNPAYLLHNPGEKKNVWADIKMVMAKLGMTIK